MRPAGGVEFGWLATREGMPARRALIPKPKSSQRRALSVPAIRDRVVRAAMKVPLEPTSDADGAPRSRCAVRPLRRYASLDAELTFSIDHRDVMERSAAR